MTMKLSIFFSLMAVATAIRKNHQRVHDFEGGKHVRRTQYYGDYYWYYGYGVRVFTDKKAFEEALSYYRLNYTMDNTFSSFLNGETSKELSVGENDVGILKINIKNENATDGGVIEKGGDGVESYSYAYEKDRTEIEFEKSDGGKLYAFAAEWDISQEWEDFYDDVYKKSELKENQKTSPHGYYDDDDYGGFTFGWDDDYVWEPYASPSDKMLHAKVGTDKFNLVSRMYYDQTRFIGFFDPEGFLSVKLFSPESADSPIDFTMSQVTVSVGEPRCPPPRPVTFILRMIEFIESTDFGGLLDFLGQFRNALPFP